MALSFTVEELQDALEDFSYSAEHHRTGTRETGIEYNMVVVTAGDTTLEFILEDTTPESSVSLDDMVEVIRYAPREAVEDIGAEFDSVETMEELVDAILASR